MMTIVSFLQLAKYRLKAAVLWARLMGQTQTQQCVVPYRGSLEFNSNNVIISAAGGTNGRMAETYCEQG